MRATLRAASARLIVGHVDPDQAAELLSVMDARDKPVTFALAEPEGLSEAAAVPAGGGAEAVHPECIRWGKLVLETVGNEALASPRRDVCDAVVDGLRVAHRRLGSDGLELIPGGSSGVGFCSASIVDSVAQVVVVPPSQVFVVHQGVALGIPESDQVGRGIWMRDDLRAEMFAGIGGVHEPDIRVYEATVSPGDTLVLASSDLARMLTEDDVRLAVTYEEAATAAERLKQLAIQRGVEAGLALVVEFSGSLEEEADEQGSGPAALLPSLPLRIEMPPIGSIFTTARDWLAETIEKVHESTGLAEQPQFDRTHPLVEEDIPWPLRPRPGAWRDQLPSGRIQVTKGSSGNGYDSNGSDETSPAPVGAGLLASATVPASSARAYTPSRPIGYSRYGSDSGRSSAIALPNLQLGAQFGPAFARIQATLLALFGMLATRLTSFQFGARRGLVVPVVSGLFVALVIVVAMRTVKAQQARQLQQRFDSLVTAAGQLETQARGTSDRVEAQSLIRRSQALVEQASTLQPNAPQLATVKGQLQLDLDHLDNIYSLPDGVLLTNFGSLAKDVKTGALAADAAAFYTLDGGGQRVLQFLRAQTQAGAAASQGDGAGGSRLGTPKLMAVRDGGVLVLDDKRNLWSYNVAKHAVDQVGLKSGDSWKEATAMAAFGQNLYVLDASLGNIFRYTSRDGTFTEAPSRYLDKDNRDLLGQAGSMAIDGSIWVLSNDGSIAKLASGTAQPFSISGLSQGIGKGSQLYTAAEQQSLYVSDALSNRVVQITKDGRYVRQFKYSLPAPATGFWPDEVGHQLYLLSGNTLYQYSLDAGR